MCSGLEVLEESIILEENIAKLYRKYSAIYSKDKAFWKKMVIEEVKHGSLLKGIKNIYLGGKSFPENMLYDDVQEIKDANKEIENYLVKLAEENISLLEAYEFAYKIENSAYELHYEKEMQLPASSDLMEMFQKLNHFDKDHARRVELLILREKSI